MRASGIWIICALLLLLLATACGPKDTIRNVQTTEYTPEGTLSRQTVESDGEIIQELSRVFDRTRIVGEGVFSNANEGLARQGALSLAVADLAAKTQSEVRRNTTVYQVEDIRDIVETNVDAIVRGYTIDYETYDEDTHKYVLRLSITGEQLVREIKTRLQEQ